MSETTRILTRELERLRREDRHREAALMQFLDEFGKKLTGQLQMQQQRDETVTGQLQALTEALDTFETRLQEFERQLSELANSLPTR